jgi:hypothetical protein
MNRDAGGAELGWLKRARESLGEAQRLLLRPTARTVEDSNLHLQAAVCCLEALTHSRRPGAKPAQEVAAEARELRKDIGRTAALLEGAAAFYFGWARVLYAATCGYTAQGEAATPPPGRTLSVEG